MSILTFRGLSHVKMYEILSSSGKSKVEQCAIKRKSSLIWRRNQVCRDAILLDDILQLRMPAHKAASNFFKTNTKTNFYFKTIWITRKYSKYRSLQKNMLVVQQADCEKIMHEVWVFRGQRGLPPVYVPKLCTGPHIGTTTNFFVGACVISDQTCVGVLHLEASLVWRIFSKPKNGWKYPV